MPLANATCRGGEGDPGEAGAGRRSAGFERLYATHAATVYRTALRVLANPAHAQDVVQDVFMRMWSQPGGFDAARGGIGNYLRLMARSRALDIWREAQAAGRARERTRILALRDAVADCDGDPALAAEARRERTIVAAALARLPEPQRKALLMAYWGGLTADEISLRTGVPVGTVKSRLRLGLMKLRTRCEPQLSPRGAAA